MMQDETTIRRVIEALHTQVLHANGNKQVQMELMAEIQALLWVIGEGVFVSGKGSYAELLEGKRL